MGATVGAGSGKQGDNVVPQAPRQLSLQLDPGLVEQHATLKQCLAARIYQQRGGITAVAGKLDMQPSHLSEVLGGGGERRRKFDLDELEAYVRLYRDPTPILYLVAKYLPDHDTEQRHALEQTRELLEQLTGAIARAVGGGRRAR